MSRRGADPSILLAAVGAALLLVGWTRPLWSSRLRLLCPLRALVGLPCPTCGGTRAFAAAVRGDWFEAMTWNPLVAIAGMSLLVAVPVAAGVVAAGRSPRWPVPSPGWGTRIAVAALVASNWIYLVLAGV